MDFRLEGVALDILVETLFGRHFTTASLTKIHHHQLTIHEWAQVYLGVVFKQITSLKLLIYLQRSVSQSILHLHLQPISTLVTSPTYTCPDEESHDGIRTCTAEEEKGTHTEGITQIPNDDNNPTVRYEGTRLEQR